MWPVIIKIHEVLKSTLGLALIASMGRLNKFVVMKLVPGSSEFKAATNVACEHPRFCW